MESNEIFKKLSTKIFGKEIDIPKEFEDYTNIIEICRNMEGIKGENKLLLTLFEIIFLENGKPRKQTDPKLLKCFKLCLDDNVEDAYLKNYVNSTETELADLLKNEKIFSKKDFRFLSFIIKIKKDFALFFRSFEDIYMEKCEKYIPSKNMEIIFSQKSFEDILFDFSLLFNILNIDAKSNFSIIVNSNYWFMTKNQSAIEVKEFKDKHQKTNLDILLNFINKNASKPKNIIPKKRNIKSNSYNHNLEDKNKKENVNKIDLLKKIEMIKKEIKDIKIRQTKSNNSLREEFNELKKEIDTLKKEQIEIEQKMKQNCDLNFIILKNLEDKISSNKDEIDQLRIANKIINEKIKKIENEKNIIKVPGISKSIINFITYSFGENINQKFYDKVSFIQKYINKKINEKKKSLLLEELKQLVTEIKTLKYDRDIFANSDITLQSFFNLIKGCENAKKILSDLDLSPMLEKFNEMYELQFSEKNYDNVYDSILEIMESKKELFYAKLGFK